MKTPQLKSILNPALVLALSLISATSLSAQPQLTAAQLAALTPLSLSNAPSMGTFWLLKGPDPSCPYPPLPCPPNDIGDVPIYALGDGEFLIDDTQVDWEAVRQQEEMDQALSDLEVQYGLRESRAGGGMFQPMDQSSYTSDDLWIELAPLTNATGYFTVHPPEAEATNGVYDLFMTTSLSPDGPGLNLTNWLWLLRTDPGETNLVVADLAPDQAYFMLARTNDTDGDGLSDAIEQLITHTDPNTADPNPFPVITYQPLSQTVYWGDTVTFTIQASGMLPLNYQWQFTPTGGTATNVNGATGPSLTLNNVDDTAAGSYSVQVWNMLGSTISSNAVLTVQYSGEYAVVLAGPRQDYRFKGDTTYYVDGSAGPVELYGSTVIEGGAVIKYSTNADAKLVIKGPLDCQTSPWGPAILTAQDDDTVGWWLSFSTGTPTNWYAAVALEVASAEDTLLRHVRIAYAQTAVHYLGSTNREVLGIARHAQILHCGAGFVSEGTTNQGCVLNLANVLMTDVGQAIGGSHFRGWAEHLTVDRCNAFASDDSSSALGFFVTNSVFGDVTSLGSGAGLDGSNNGFYQGHSPQFGAGQLADDQPPFAPTGGVDEYNVPYIYFVNGQGAYYLRDESPFEGTGATNVDATLSSDFAQMTTAVPPDLFSDDINSSMTLGPTAPRDPLTANLGYHYPVVDYVLLLATVNNATLNIDQGTVLGLVGCPYWGQWGLRLNPGGRLNVNGVPTNRVVFAHLEALQESPVSELALWGPTITWRELHFASGPPTPYPEAKVQYADFLTVSGGWNAHFDAINSYLSLSYSIITNLELNGCYLQGGWFVYDDGGPAGRALKLRNTVFDRCAVWVYDAGAYEEYFGASGCSAQVTAVNNLFYQCFMVLAPVAGSGSGAGWTFTDNIFDHASFYPMDYYNSFLNGPVGVNHHNAYVGMSNVPNGGGRLSPPAPTTTDPDLPSLTYDTGSLGGFYLPAVATNLFGKGSRTAGAAGEYHFTCLTNNQKEAGAQVSIGPHYLALTGGAVPDSNGDGIPDFLADRNGDGVEQANEVPWQTSGTGSLTVLSPPDGSTAAGIIPVWFGPGTNSADAASVGVLVDGAPQLCSSEIGSPAGSTASLEIDTTYLANGPHTLSVQAGYAQAPDGTTGSSGYTIESPAVTLNVTNAIRYPAWQDQAELAFKVDVESDLPSPEYTISFFNSAYPKAQDPFGAQTAYYDGVATNGIISYSEVPAYLNFSDANTDPDLYSFTEFAATGSSAPQARANRNTRQTLPFPPVGKWVVTYEMNGGDWWWNSTNKQFEGILDTKDTLGDYYYHDVRLGGWLASALTSADNNGPLRQLPGGPSQTWPVRDTKGTKANRKDVKLLLQFLTDTNVANFYGNGHGGVETVGGSVVGSCLGFMSMKASDLQRKLENKRFRFAFLDGCGTYPGALRSAFGADAIETGSGFSGDPGPLELTAYTGNLRPAAFLTWSQTIPTCANLAEPTVDESGKRCTAQVVKGLCFFHGQLTSGWAYGEGWGPLGLWDAIFWAKYWTTQLFTPQDLEYLNLDNLKQNGYIDLRCTEYNHAGDWQQTP